MPELKDHMSLAYIWLEVEHPFWAPGRVRRERTQSGGWTRGKMRNVK